MKSNDKHIIETIGNGTLQIIPLKITMNGGNKYNINVVDEFETANHYYNTVDLEKVNMTLSDYLLLVENDCKSHGFTLKPMCDISSHNLAIIIRAIIIGDNLNQLFFIAFPYTKENINYALGYPMTADCRIGIKTFMEITELISDENRLKILL